MYHDVAAAVILEIVEQLLGRAGGHVPGGRLAAVTADAAVIRAAAAAVVVQAVAQV